MFLFRSEIHLLSEENAEEERAESAKSSKSEAPKSALKRVDSTKSTKSTKSAKSAKSVAWSTASSDKHLLEEDDGEPKQGLCSRIIAGMFLHRDCCKKSGLAKN